MLVTMHFHLAPRFLTLTADLYRLLIQRLERSRTAVSFESYNRFAQALDELAEPTESLLPSQAPWS